MVTNRGEEWLYIQAAPFAQNALVSAYGFQLRRSRQGSGFEKHSEELPCARWLGAAGLQAYQDKQTQRVMHHCDTHVATRKG
jgi:hypothetical protein